MQLGIHPYDAIRPSPVSLTLFKHAPTLLETIHPWQYPTWVDEEQINSTKRNVPQQSWASLFVFLFKGKGGEGKRKRRKRKKKRRKFSFTLTELFPRRFSCLKWMLFDKAMHVSADAMGKYYSLKTPTHSYDTCCILICQHSVTPQ